MKYRLSRHVLPKAVEKTIHQLKAETCRAVDQREELTLISGALRMQKHPSSLDGTKMK